MIITRMDLINQLVSTFNYTKKAAANIVDDFCSVILTNLEQGNEVRINNFGKFAITKKCAKRFKNVNTGQMFDSPEHLSPKFYPARRMKLAVAWYQENADKLEDKVI